MSTYLQLLAAWRNPLELLAEISGRDAAALRADGLEASLARQLAWLAAVYTNIRHCRTLAESAVAGIVENRHTLGTLMVIEKYARRAATSAQRWQIRERLAAERPNEAALRALGRKLLAELTDTPSPGPEHVSVRRIAGTLSSTLTLTAPQHLAKAAADFLRRELDHDPHAVSRALERVCGTASGDGPEVTLNVVVGVRDLAAIMAGDGDDIRLALTNGAIMTGAQLLRARIGRFLNVGMFSWQGPVALYRTERLASATQRTLAAMSDPACAVDGCAVGADDCQMNHNTPWAHGGETNLDNLSCVCRFHNQTWLDKDPARPRHGTIVQEDGVNRYAPPDGSSPRRSTNPVMGLGAMQVLHRNLV